MYRIAVCDDNTDVLKELEQMLYQEYNKDIICVICIQDLTAYLKLLEDGNETMPDIVIMDICWDEKEKSGIECTIRLQKLFPKLKVIFLSGYLEYVSDIFMAKPSYFLLKPIQKEKLKEAIDISIAEIDEERSQQLVIRYSGDVVILNPTDIIYIESNKHEITIFGMEEERRLWMKMSDLLSRLPNSFIRIHQSYSVNAAFVKKISTEGVELFNDKILPISRRRYTKARNQFFDYLEKI